MAFLPLQYALDSVTVWHLLIWLVLSASPLIFAEAKSISRRFDIVANFALLIAVSYCWVASIVGQLFDDKFTWAQIWPSGFVLGTIFSLGAALHFSKQSKGASIAIIALGIPFYGFGMSAASWAIPRIAGWGVVDLPKMAWGVSL